MTASIFLIVLSPVLAMPVDLIRNMSLLPYFNTKPLRPAEILDMDVIFLTIFLTSFTEIVLSSFLFSSISSTIASTVESLISDWGLVFELKIPVQL